MAVLPTHFQLLLIALLSAPNSAHSTRIISKVETNVPAPNWPDVAAAVPDIRPMTAAEQAELGGAAAILGVSFESAAKGLRVAVRLYEASYGSTHPRTAAVRTRLAEHLIDLRRYAEAEIELDRADQTLARRTPPGHPLRMSAIATRNLLLSRQHRIAEQVVLAGRALTELQMGAPISPLYEIEAESWRGLAAWRAGDYRSAEIHYRAYLRGISAAPEAAIASRGAAADALARLLVDMGKRREAADLLAPLITEAAKDENANAVVLAAMLETKGEIAGYFNQFGRAEQALRRARTLRKDDELTNYRRGSASRIALRLNRELRREERIDAPMGSWANDDATTSSVDLRNVPQIRDSISALAVDIAADVYGTNLLWAEDVLPLRQKLLGWFEQKFGAAHPETARARGALAVALLAAGQPFASERELQRSLAAQRAALPAQSEEIGQGLLTLGRIYLAQGRRAEALAAFGEAVRTFEATDESDSYWVREARLAQARTATTAGDTRLAVSAWESLGKSRALSSDELSIASLRQAMTITQEYVRYAADRNTCPSAGQRAQMADIAKGLNEVRADHGMLRQLALYTQAEAEACAGNFDVAAKAIDAAKGSTFGLTAEDFGRDKDNSAIRQVRLVRALMADSKRMKSNAFETVPESPGAVSFASFQSAATIGMELARAETAARSLLAGANANIGGIEAIRARSQQETGGRSIFDFVFSTRLDFDWRVHELQDGPGPIIDQRIAVLRSGLAIGAAQDLERAAAAQVLAQASARLGQTDSALGKLLRERDSLSKEQRSLASAIAAISIGASAGLTAVVKDSGRTQDRFDAVLARLVAIDASLRENFPDYFNLTDSRSFSIADIRSNLVENEAVLLIRPVGKDVHVFLVTKRNVGWNRLRGGSQEIADLVSALRCDTDAATCQVGTNVTGRVARGVPRLRSGVGPDRNQLTSWEAPSFDRTKAWRLYEMILGPLAALLAKDGVFGEEVNRLYTVVSGPLSALPLGVLLTAKPTDDGLSTTGRALLDAPWLANKFTIVSLPSVSSLALKPAASASSGPLLVGYGDPVLDGASAQPISIAGIPTPTMMERNDNGSRARPDVLRRLLPLPGTKAELEQVARLYPAGSAMIRLRSAATEAALKSDVSLATARNVIFSTHGLLPGEAVDDVEPGLVFTPPTTASETDDGLLTASEAATLLLNADLVILSACNTATSDSTPGADSLSSLARSFLYAGARGIYASHWRVSDDITPQLMKTALGLRRDGRSRAEALGEAMRAIRSGVQPDGSPVPFWTPDWAHPSAWAPFVIFSGADR